MTDYVHPPHLGRPPGEHTEHPPADRIRAYLRLLLLVIAQNKRLRQQIRDLGGTPEEGLPPDHPLMVAAMADHSDALRVAAERIRAAHDD